MKAKVNCRRVAVWAAAVFLMMPAFAGRLTERIAASCTVKGTDRFYGFERTTFDFQGHEAWVVEPSVEPTEGCPWTWTMQWATAFVDRTPALHLLKEGWHHVTIDTYRHRMDEEGIAVSAAFQRFLVEKLGFAPKACLIGMSWGGFFSTRYAAAHPENVRAIYYDCPLLNFDKFRDFPPEKIRGEIGVWAKSVPAGGWSDDPRMPVNKAAAIAAAKIPVYLIYGGADRVVPPETNSELFLPRFKAAGGQATVWKREGWGHHPHGVDVNDYRLAVFFRNATYGEPTGIRVRSGDRIAFLGDSITQFGNRDWGYLGLVMDGLKRTGVDAVKIAAGISGHKSNDMLARVDRDVIAKKPTWMTLSVGVNDVGHGAKGVELAPFKENVTAICDKADAAGIKVMILTPTLLTYKKDFAANARNVKLQGYCEFLRELAAKRGYPVADLDRAMRAHLTAGGDDPTTDNLHMNGIGNQIMARGVLEAFGVAKPVLDAAQTDWNEMPSMMPFVNNVHYPDRLVSPNDYRVLERAAAESGKTAGDCAFDAIRDTIAEKKGTLPRPRPSAALRERLKSDADVIGIVHWGLNTYTDREWGFGDEDPAKLDPKAFNADQIVGACAAGGLKGLVIVAKHHDGFCLWPTKTTEHNITKSPFRGGKGDYVREMERACRKHGLKFGVYVSPWDRNNAHYGTEKYVSLYHEQIKELLSGDYGEVFEMWFDGANGGDGWYGGANEKRIIPNGYYRFDEVFAFVRKMQPKVCIFAGEIDDSDFRWPGNEQGRLDPNSRATIATVGGFADGEYGNPDYAYQINMGAPSGRFFRVCEADFPLRKGWFYHAKDDGHSKHAAYLLQRYVDTVGNGGTMNLGVSPTRDGVLPPEDVKALAGFKALKDAFFAHEVTTDGQPFNVVVLSEDISVGEQVDHWTIFGDLRPDGKRDWIDSGRAIGRRRIRILDKTHAPKKAELCVTKTGPNPGKVTFRRYLVDDDLLKLVREATTDSGETDTAKWMTGAR